MSTWPLRVAGHPRWLSVPLSGEPEQAAAAVVSGLVGGQPHVLHDTVAVLAGTSRLVRQEAERLRAEGVDTLLAWSLLPAPGLLVPGPVASLRVRPLPSGADDDAVLREVCDLARPHHGGVDVETVDTASGPALAVRYRPVRTVDGQRLVDEHRLVVWPRHEQAATLELSLYVVDLVDGGRAAGPLQELAAGVRWAPA